MVKLTTLIAEREKGDGLYFAVEYFPPRTADGLTKLYERSARIATQGERPARGGSSRVAFLLAFSFFLFFFFLFFFRAAACLALTHPRHPRRRPAVRGRDVGRWRQHVGPDAGNVHQAEGVVRL